MLIEDPGALELRDTIAMVRKRCCASPFCPLLHLSRRVIRERGNQLFFSFPCFYCTGSSLGKDGSQSPQLKESLCGIRDLQLCVITLHSVESETLLPIVAPYLSPSITSDVGRTLILHSCQNGIGFFFKVAYFSAIPAKDNNASSYENKILKN